MKFEQHAIAGGHEVVAETEVADGHLRVEMTWQNIVDEWLDVAGSTLTGRRAYLNGALVKDPDLAQRLWAEACQR